MNKPTIKKEVAIDVYHKSVGYIYFYSTTDALGDFELYGHVATANKNNYYSLRVDARFDFDEVVGYMDSYG